MVLVTACELHGAQVFGGYVDLGSGADTIQVVSSAVNGANVFGGEGNDTLRFQHALINTTVGAGSGADLLSFSAGQALTTTLVFGGKQKDTISLIGGETAAAASIGGGKGADYLNLSAAGALASTNVGGGQGGDSIRLGTAAIGSVSGGGMNDTIRVIGQYAGGAIFGDGKGVTTAGTGTGGAAGGRFHHRWRNSCWFRFYLRRRC